MERTQVYLGADQKEKLTRLSQIRGLPMAELIREAVDQYLVEHDPADPQEVLAQTFGLWEERGDLPGTSQEMVEKLRSGWKERRRRLNMDEDEEGKGGR
ncbi:MAG: CopG family transcriptional regulator [Syntrophothermus sp.]